MSGIELDIVHASLDTFLDDSKNESDVKRLLNLNAHSYALTETGQNDTFKMIKRICKERDTHTAYNPDQGDITFILRNDCRHIEFGGKLIIPAGDGHGPRCNSFNRFEYMGEYITHTAIHAVALHADHRTPAIVKQRKEQQLKQIEAMAVQIQKYGQGRSLSIGSADLNAVLPDNKTIQGIFNEYGLTTTAHETGVNDPTHGNRRIDYIFTLDRDKRLVVRTMRVLHSGKYASDHDPIIARLNIMPRAGGR